MKQFLYWLKSKRFRIVIVPETGDKSFQPKVITGKQFFRFGTGGTVMLLLFLLLILFNPYPGIFSSWFFGENEQSVRELTKKVTQLNYEIDEMRKMNRNLIRALNLGDSTLKLEDHDTTSKKSSQIQGNVLIAVLALLEYEENDIITLHSPAFIRPVGGLITRGFLPENGHFGIDFGIKQGTPVYAAATGTVLFADYGIDEGYVMILLHSGGFITVYKHCSQLFHSVGKRIQQGEMIALSGNTGEKSYGPHLHFELWKNEQPVDPKIYLEGL